MNLSTTPSHRTGEALVKVIDKNGNPVANKELVLNQKSHEFLFGSGAFEFHHVDIADLLIGNEHEFVERQVS